jgi:hypothetical protein
MKILKKGVFLMIHTGFVHAADIDYEAQRVYEENVAEVDEILANIYLQSSRMDTLKEFGITESVDDEYYTESVKGAVSAIGQKILDIIQAFKDFVKGIFDSFKQKSWNRKSTEQKLAKIKKEDPSRYNQLQFYVDKGLLDFDSFKDLSDYYKNIDKVLEEIKKSDVDPESIRGKLNAAGKKLEANKDKITTTAAILGLVATGTTIIYNVSRIRGDKVNRLANEAHNTEVMSNKSMQNIRNSLDSLEGDPNNKDFVTKQALLHNIAADVDKKSKVNISKRLSLSAIIWSKIDKIAETALKVSDPIRQKSSKYKSVARIKGENYDGVEKDFTNELDRLQSVNQSSRLAQGQPLTTLKRKEDESL